MTTTRFGTANATGHLPPTFKGACPDSTPKVSVVHKDERDNPRTVGGTFLVLHDLEVVSGSSPCTLGGFGLGVGSSRSGIWARSLIISNNFQGLYTANT